MDRGRETEGQRDAETEKKEDREQEGAEREVLLASKEKDGVLRPQGASALGFWLNCSLKILFIAPNIQ